MRFLNGLSHQFPLRQRRWDQIITISIRLHPFVVLEWPFFPVAYCPWDVLLLLNLNPLAVPSLSIMIFLNDAESDGVLEWAAESSYSTDPVNS
jgi:hypothetical protein